MKRILLLALITIVVINPLIGQDKKLYDKFLETLFKAKESFPKDSSSLNRFYLKSSPPRNSEKAIKHTKRIEKILTPEFKITYDNVDKNLKPLIKKITSKNNITKTDIERFTNLYSEYDKYRGESLFSNLINNDENYSLVWESFRKISELNNIDTCSISCLINLDNAIRTNVELAETTAEFVSKSIKNNPISFLKMFSVRNKQNREKLCHYLYNCDTRNKELFDIFIRTSQNSNNEKHKKLAKEILEIANKLY